MFPPSEISPTATKIKVVIDTNVLLVSISSRSRYHSIYRSFLEGFFTLCVTTDVLDEYEEIMGYPHHLGPEVTQYVLETIDNAPNVIYANRYYRWQLITADPDDDKFVDGALACNADYIVTNDTHFNVLKAVQFPRVAVISANEFLEILLANNV